MVNCGVQFVGVHQGMCFEVDWRCIWGISCNLAKQITLLTLLRILFLGRIGSISYVLPIRQNIDILNRDIRVGRYEIKATMFAKNYYCIFQILLYYSYYNFRNKSPEQGIENGATCYIQENPEDTNPSMDFVL